MRFKIVPVVYVKTNVALMFRLWNSFNPPASSSCASTHSLPTSDETRLPVQSVSDQPFSLPVSMENSPGMMLLKTFKLQIVINSFTIFTDSISLRWTILLLLSALFLQWSIIVTRSKKILPPQKKILFQALKLLFCML